MRRILLCVTSAMIMCVSCKKDKFNTVPSLKLKSISSKTIPVSGNMRIELEFTDKQGDISEDSLLLVKVRNNQNVTTTILDTINLQIPKFPGKNKGIIELLLDYNFHLVSAISPPGAPLNPESDSLTMKFVLKDNASHHSDTLVINDIVIQR